MALLTKIFLIVGSLARHKQWKYYRTRVKIFGSEPSYIIGYLMQYFYKFLFKLLLQSICCQRCCVKSNSSLQISRNWHRCCSWGLRDNEIWVDDNVAQTFPPFPPSTHALWIELKDFKPSISLIWIFSLQEIINGEIIHLSSAVCICVTLNNYQA